MMKPYCSFIPGDMVVCVDDTPPNPDVPRLISRGSIYTVVDVTVSPRWAGAGIRLAEVSAAPYWGFAAERFRRVVDTTRTVEALRKIVIDEFSRDSVPA